MDRPTPQPGDAVVIFEASTQETRLGVIDSTEAYGPQLLMVVCEASAFRPRAHPEYVACSGGPCPGIRPNDLTLVGLREQRFWDWDNNRPSAGAGRDYTEVVNLWAYIDPS